MKTSFYLIDRLWVFMHLWEENTWNVYDRQRCIKYEKYMTRFNFTTDIYQRKCKMQNKIIFLQYNTKYYSHPPYGYRSSIDDKI